MLIIYLFMYLFIMPDGIQLYHGSCMHGSFKDCVMVLLLLCKGQMVYAVRERCGRQLAVEASVEADIVSTVPESATPAALGYAQQVAVGFVLTSGVQFCLLCNGCSCTHMCHFIGAKQQVYSVSQKSSLLPKTFCNIFTCDEPV